MAPRNQNNILDDIDKKAKDDKPLLDPYEGLSDKYGGSGKEKRDQHRQSYLSIIKFDFWKVS